VPPSFSGDDTDGNPSDRRRKLIAAYAVVLVLLVAGSSFAATAQKPFA
jgi:hypothetical protein